jgi:hypothetical protein
MRISRCRLGITIAAGALACAFAVGISAMAGAATPAPAVSTGPPTKLTFQSARFTGKVNPRGIATTFWFEYGPTKRYGARTPAAGAGHGTRAVNVHADVGGLSPFTVYHYRLVARSRGGTTHGADRAFKTRKQPLALGLSSTPDPVPFGSGATVAGTLSGTDHAGRQIVLQQKAFPFTAAWAPVGNPQVTTAAGAFSFPVLSVPVNTQFRAVTRTSPRVFSPIITVGAAVSVSTHVKTRVIRGHRLRFSGTVRPAHDGAQYAIQRFTRGQWRTVSGSITLHGRSTFSRYARRVRIRHGGHYRVYVRIVDGDHVPNVGRTVVIHTRHRKR